MNTLPKTINGATLPDNEVWFNPQNLKAEDFGPDHRPMTKTEWERTENGVPCSFYSQRFGCFVDSLYYAGSQVTYRLPSSTPFLRPEKEWTPKFSVGDWVTHEFFPEGRDIVSIEQGKWCRVSNTAPGVTFHEDSLTLTTRPILKVEKPEPGTVAFATHLYQQMIGTPTKPETTTVVHGYNGDPLPEPFAAEKAAFARGETIQYANFNSGGQQGQWHDFDGNGDIDENGGYRTWRVKPKTEPEPPPAVTDAILDKCIEIIASEQGEGDCVARALSYAFSQVLPGLEEKLRLTLEDRDNFGSSFIDAVKQRDHAMAELQKARAELGGVQTLLAERTRVYEYQKTQLNEKDDVIAQLRTEVASMEAEMVKCLAIINAVSPVKEGGSLSATIADLTLRLEMQSQSYGVKAHCLKEVLIARDTHKARADKAEAERDDARLQINTACAKLVVMAAELEFVTDGRLETSIRHVEELIRRLRAELAALQWTPLSVRKPTAEDADENGQVEFLQQTGKTRRLEPVKWSAPGFTNPTLGLTTWTHWRRTNLPVEKVDEFEEWFHGRLGDVNSHKSDFKSAMRAAWNKAREAKP